MNSAQQDLPLEKQDQVELNARLERAQNGEEAAFSALYHQYAPLMEHAVQKYFSYGIPEADLRSDAAAAFCSAVNHFDRSRSGVTFGLYAEICIENRLISLLRAHKQTQRTLSLEGLDPELLCAGEESDPAHAIAEAERYTELCKKMEAVLSLSEREIWLLFISGFTAPQIAERLQTNKKSVENALFRARKKLRKSFSEQ